MFNKLSRGKKIAAFITITLFIVLISPVAIRAATDGEVDVYGELIARIQQLETENAILRNLLGNLLAADQPKELEEAGQEAQAGGPTEPELLAQEEGGSEPDPEPEPEPEPEPDPEPEPPDEPPPPPPPPNPYADLSLSGVHVAMIDYRAVFGKYKIVVSDPGATDMSHFYPIDGDIICFTDEDKGVFEERLIEGGATFETKSLSVDPRLYEITDGKKFGSRTEVINYIEKVIAGEIKP